MLRQAGDRGLAAGRLPLPQQTLQHPGTEGVELAHPAHVDGDVSRAFRLTFEAARDLLELAGMGGGPRAASRKLKPLAFELARQQCRAHPHGAPPGGSSV